MFAQASAAAGARCFSGKCECPCLVGRGKDTPAWLSADVGGTAHSCRAKYGCP
jgi:hypothetical protein